MCCSLIRNLENCRGTTDFSRFHYLHNQGKKLILTWFERANSYNINNKEDVFEPFIFLWFAFNGWAASVTEKETDREIISIISLDRKINQDFAKINNESSDISKSIKDFFEFLPIFDAKIIHKKNLYNSKLCDRKELIKYYMSKGVNKFEPRCCIEHMEQGNPIPMDWTHFICAVYKVRCNLFHGFKSAHSEMDQSIVFTAFKSLSGFLKKTGYLKD